MEIKKVNDKYKCEISGCRNLADYCIENEENQRYNMYLCKSCIENLNKTFSKILTPKSIKNVYQKGDKNV